jgi:hypothetical protein
MRLSLFFLGAVANSSPPSLVDENGEGVEIELSDLGHITTGKCSPSEFRVWVNNPEFSSKMDSYARWNAGRGSVVAAKLMEDYKPNLSAPCASCHGDMVSCGTRRCWAYCILSTTSEGCVECSRRECLGSYMRCVGVTDEALMPLTPRPESTTTPAPKRTRSTSTTSAPTSITTTNGPLGRQLQEDVTQLPVITSTYSTLLPLDSELWTIVEEDESDDTVQL